MDRRKLVNILADWADTQPIIRRVILFGSRAREDNRPDSDVDIRIEFNDSGACQEAMELWSKEVQADFAALKARLPSQFSLHNDARDAALSAILEALRHPECTERKVFVAPTSARQMPVPLR